MATTPGLTWGVKDSLVAYVEGLDDGAVAAEVPATRTAAGFHFPWDPDVPGDTDRSGEADVAGDPHGGAAGELRFRGAVRFAGHWGALAVELRDPRVVWDGAAGTLLFRDGGRDRWTPFADLTARTAEGGASEAGPVGDAAVVVARAALTGYGRLLLDGQYPVGTALNDVRIDFPRRDG